MSAKKVVVPKISCHHCVATIKRELEELDGVKTVSGDVDTKEVNIEWDAPASWDIIAATLTEIGYPANE